MNSRPKISSVLLLASSIIYVALVLNRYFLVEMLGANLFFALGYTSTITMIAALMWKVSKESGEDDFTLDQARRTSPSTMPFWLPFAISGIVLLICFKNIQNGFFIRDDALYFLHVRFGGNPLRDLTRVFCTNNFRPFELLPWYMDHIVWGTWAPGFFLTNAAIHIINCILVFLISQRLLGQRSQQIFATLLYAIHPICTDLCCYLSNRHTLFSAFFVLATIKAYDCYLRTGLRNYYKASLGLCLVGVFVRESVCALPFLLVLWELFFRGRDIISSKNQRKNAIRSLAPFFLITIIFFAWRTYLLGGMARFIDNQEMSVFANLRVFLFTMPQQFFIQKDFLISRSPGTVKAVYGFLSLFVIITIFIRSINFKASDYKALFFSFAWILLASIPTFNLMSWSRTIPPSYVHLPFIGFCLILGALWDPRKRFLATIERFLCILLLSFFFFNSLLVAKSFRIYRYPPIRKALQTNLVRFIRENYANSDPATVFLIRDVPKDRLKLCHDNWIKCLGGRSFLDYLFLPVVTEEEARKWQTGSEIILPEILRNQVWLNQNEIHAYSSNVTMRSRGEVEGFLLCTGNDEDEDDDGIIDNIYVFRSLGPGCRPLGDDFYKIYRYIRSPHWDLPYRRMGMKHPTFSDVKGKSWNAKYIRYLPDDKFEEISELEFFELKH